MSRIGGKNTAPEWIVRRLVHKMGYRYRLHRRDLPGTPDLVFASRRKAIFVHGCFWHGHGCRIGRPPKSKLDYWAPKLAANRARDARKTSELEAAGWHVMTVWQCETKDIDALRNRLWTFLGRPRGANDRRHPIR